MRRTWRLLFVVVACVSLLANAVMIGVGVRAHQSGVGPFAGALGVAAQIPAEERRAILWSLRDNRAEIASLRRALQAKRQAMLVELLSETPDRPAIEAAMADVREATSALQRAVQRVVVDTIVGSQERL